MGVMSNTLLYSVVASLPVQVFCMCFFKYRVILVNIPSKMSITDAHHICRVISKSYLIFLPLSPSVQTPFLFVF